MLSKITLEGELLRIIVSWGLYCEFRQYLGGRNYISLVSFLSKYREVRNFNSLKFEQRKDRILLKSYIELMYIRDNVF